MTQKQIQHQINLCSVLEKLPDSKWVFCGILAPHQFQYRADYFNHIITGTHSSTDPPEHADKLSLPAKMPHTKHSTCNQKCHTQNIPHVISYHDPTHKNPLEEWIFAKVSMLLITTNRQTTSLFLIVVKIYTCETDTLSQKQKTSLFLIIAKIYTCETDITLIR